MPGLAASWTTCLTLLAALLCTMGPGGTPPSLAAPIGQIISYQGKLTNGTGFLVPNGDYALTFKIYQTGNATPLFTQTSTVPTRGGIFTAFLNVGGLTFDPTLSYDFGITYNGTETRHPIAAVPVAKSAETATTATSVTTATTALTAGSAASFTGTLSGDASGSQGAVSVDKLKGIPITTAAPHQGQTLRFDGTQWVLDPPDPAAPPEPSITYTEDSGSQALCFDGENLWVTNFNGNTVSKVRLDGSLVGKYSVGARPTGVCFDGISVWVSNSASNTVTRLRASDGAVLGTYPVGNEPQGICYDNINSVWVANRLSNTVTKLGTSDGALRAVVAVGNGPYGICFDGTNFWTANQNGDTVTRSNIFTGARADFTVGQGTTPPTGYVPVGICYDGANIWVANSHGNSVSKLQASTGAVLGLYSVGVLPRHLCFDGKNIWVTNLNGNSVTKLQGSVGSVLANYSVSSPYGICFDGFHVWTANAGPNDVTRLPRSP